MLLLLGYTTIAALPSNPATKANPMADRGETPSARSSEDDSTRRVIMAASNQIAKELAMATGNSRLSTSVSAKPSRVRTR